MNTPVQDLRNLAVETAKKIVDHKGTDTVLINVSEISSWTDYFLISTAMSSGHLRGLVKELRRFLADQNIEIQHKHKRIDDDGWELLDCGNLIIHLMSQEKREFYDLDMLWHGGKKIEIKSG
ncbi:MAG: ribosome silencing factor [Bacteroidales bacterium]|nr:ribosome silencing factor [Bacteroidales bacterium]